MTHTASLNMLFGETKRLADIWTGYQMKIDLTWKLALKAQGPLAPMTQREDYCRAVKVIKKCARKGEQ